MVTKIKLFDGERELFSSDIPDKVTANEIMSTIEIAFVLTKVYKSYIENLHWEIPKKFSNQIKRSLEIPVKQEKTTLYGIRIEWYE